MAEESRRREATLGVVTTMTVYQDGEDLAIHVATGRVLDALAKNYEKVYLCAGRVVGTPRSATDLKLQSRNVELIPHPPYGSIAGSFKHVLSIMAAYLKTCRRSDALFVRGMCPFIGTLYMLAWMFGCRVCHWLVGNPIALLQSHTRRGKLMDRLALLYARHDRLSSRFGRWLTRGAFVCNGQELGDEYPSPRTFVTASSTVMDEEFYEREDTCRDETVKILFVGYIRPEKGVEYLLEALPRLKCGRPWNLTLVGPDRFPEYHERLDRIAERHGITDQLNWAGYVSFGEPMFKYLREADLFVLPTLSEGTPHVLVESRANGLPSISTTVGGVPTTVTDGFDALLVPPKDSDALATAIDRIVEDEILRRSLIRNGLASARKLTVARFAELVQRTLED